MAKLARAASNRAANLRLGNLSLRTPPFFCRAATSWLPSGCPSGASHACAVSELAGMNSRYKFALCCVGLFIVVILLFAAVKAPPDGVEHGDFSQFVGRFHPLAVHFPIALILLAALLECAGLFRNGKNLQSGAGFILALAAGSAIVAVFLGWMLGRSGGYEGGPFTPPTGGG